ncbi:NDMA-dependent alcohol dehydrogenase [Cryptosporangium aurantiacum]|uniref:S-(Hydroxymethyl)glutathione dehydrogenase / alcohol dehydrogenase n=1 Tax=Cryptosporangium aurantiacum TaxID=134849 RepID=A0A1M7PJI1_9ACTN|nr:NDMA-dependent alcohol dehydrogenase [Cryptosporangium aurantiacum]SHN17358.1 S-(hydroxymethyl)glutathione dehydrogenase / alcohol dehydrogenase [Cryptosporangium aurantiacum]
MRTRAAVITGVGKDWEVTDVELDPPRAGEVRVKMSIAGICHSDDHYASGDQIPSAEIAAQMVRAGLPEPRYFPMIGGHEGAGIVEEIGPGVRDLTVGDHVAVSFIPSCGRCRWCATGQSYICDRGAQLFSTNMVTDGTPRRYLDREPVIAMMQVGTFSEHVVVAADSVIKIDADLPLTAASLVSCGVTTGYGAAVNRASVGPGDTVVVIGVGGVGINAVQGAALAGAQHVVAVDPAAFKRESAERFGATHTAESAQKALRLVRDLTHGVMADSVILAPGVLHVELMTTAMAMIRKGGICVPVAITPLAETSVPISMADLVGSVKEIRGTLYGNLNPRASMPALLAMYRSGKLRLDDLITTTYRLDDINDAFADMRAGKNLRGAITF